MRYTVYFLDRRLFKICLKGKGALNRVWGWGALLIKFAFHNRNSIRNCNSIMAKSFKEKQKLLLILQRYLRKRSAVDVC